MISKDILKKIKRIEITTRHLVDTVLQGEYLSSFKGRGIEFTEVREYVEGDDIRAIDWNVTARMNHPYVKTFIEERELQVIFCADLSPSLNFGSLGGLKNELLFEFTAAMALTTNINNDRAGFLGFTSEVEKYIPPKKGKKHTLRIIREILNPDRKGKGTDLTKAMLYLSHVLKKRSTVFVISDFYDNHDYHNALKILKHRHDVIAVILRDRRDYEMPDVGLLPLFDAEEGRTIWADTGDKGAMEKFAKAGKSADASAIKTFKKLGIDYITLTCGEPFISALISFFKQRERRYAR